MLQNLAKCSRTRRVTANAIFVSPPSIAHASRRFYAVGANRDIANFLNECAEKERSSVPISQFRTRSLEEAAGIIENLDFEVQHGDELKKVVGITRPVRNRVNVFLGHTKEYPPEELFNRNKAIGELAAIPGIGIKAAEVLYDAGCDTVAKLRLEKYNKTLLPTAKKSVKYMSHTEFPAPRENLETIVEFCRYFLPMDKYEIILAGDYRRGASAISEPIEILVVDKSTTDPIPTPPHPSTLKPPGPHRPTRIKLPFTQVYVNSQEKATSVLLTKIIKPLEDLGVVSDTTKTAVNMWRGWMRVPKRGKPWESRKERLDGIQKLDGDFHRVNITYAPKRSGGSALLVLTGDEDYFIECTRKAIQAGLYLNEWGLWKWEPDSQPLSRFQTSDPSRERVSLGVIWGSETEADTGRWVQSEFEEEQIFDAIMGEYVPPNKRDIMHLREKAKQKKTHIPAKSP